METVIKIIKREIQRYQEKPGSSVAQTKSNREKGFIAGMEHLLQFLEVMEE